MATVSPTTTGRSPPPAAQAAEPCSNCVNGDKPFPFAKAAKGKCLLATDEKDFKDACQFLFCRYRLFQEECSPKCLGVRTGTNNRCSECRRFFAVRKVEFDRLRAENANAKADLAAHQRRSDAINREAETVEAVAKVGAYQKRKTNALRTFRDPGGTTPVVSTAAFSTLETTVHRTNVDDKNLALPGDFSGRLKAELERVVERAGDEKTQHTGTNCFGRDAVVVLDRADDLPRGRTFVYGEDRGGTGVPFLRTSEVAVDGVSMISALRAALVDWLGGKLRREKGPDAKIDDSEMRYVHYSLKRGEDEGEMTTPYILHRDLPSLFGAGKWIVVLNVTGKARITTSHKAADKCAREVDRKSRFVELHHYLWPGDIYAIDGHIHHQVEASDNRSALVMRPLAWRDLEEQPVIHKRRRGR
mmetsp:Transcript_20980/g.67584  ORF Transcript_20980/g.67584 Transcript_20980/m.67584 type:complete len:416 (-) Transcript_20980:84-1331(-)